MQIAKCFLKYQPHLLEKYVVYAQGGVASIFMLPSFEVGEHASMSLSVGPSLPHLSTNYKFCNMYCRDGSFFN